jgi:signal transduction histidine kinase
MSTGSGAAYMPTESLAEEQAALRRVATLVARGAPPPELFAAVAAEVGRILPVVDVAYLGRYDADGTVEFVGAWAREGKPGLVGERVGIGGGNAATLVFATKAPARIDRLTDASAATQLARSVGSRSSAGAPINVAGRLWGVMTVSSSREGGLPLGLEARLAGFTELVATAIANAQAREELHTMADEQAALRRVATLVARAARPEEVFTAVTAEVGRLFYADFAFMFRYEADGEPAVTVLGSWAASGAAPPAEVGERVEFEGENITSKVFHTRRPARVEGFGDDAGAALPRARSVGLRSGVGAPVSVQSRLWGVIMVASVGEAPLPVDTEARLVGFTELVATAIANAEAREELRMVADEQAALRRVATLVARGARPAEVFAAATDEVGRLLGTDTTWLRRYLPGPAAASIAAFAAGRPLPPEEPRPLGGGNIATLVYETGQPAWVEGSDWLLADWEGRPLPITSGVGVPVIVEGGLWGVMSVASSTEAPLPPGTEARLTAFTELIATAIANAEAHDQLAASRARVVASADEARRRIERDLHDGAQQQFISLALKLRAVQALVSPQQVELAHELAQVATGLADAVQDLRELARGIHPAVLAEAGLAPALRNLARRSPVPVRLTVRVEDRLPELVEVTAHYVVSEALTNAAKHAKATVVQVEVEATDSALRVAVHDDGIGGADPRRGSGLLGLKDRVEAVGGTITLHSPLDEGTRLLVDLPLRPAPAPG